MLQRSAAAPLTFWLATLIAALDVAAVAPLAHAGERGLDPASRLAHAAEDADLTLHADLAQAARNGLTPRFGEPGHWWLSLGGGAGFGGKTNVDYNGFVGFSTFLVDDVELNLELAGWFFDQDSQDAGAANFNLVFKWHFINEDDWSLFVDGGAGVLLATEEVPSGGTNFNFTPRAGMGVTFRLGDSPNRLIIGGRWQHISNARISGDDDNPGRDTGMVYAGIVIPF